MISLPNVTLAWEDAKKYLTNPSRVNDQPAVKPSGGVGYLFRAKTISQKNDFICDQYRFIYIGTYKNVSHGLRKRYYHMKSPEGKGRSSSPGFQRHVYTILDEEEDKSKAPICLIHYVGDCSLHVDSTHGNAIKKTGIYLPTTKHVMETIKSDTVKESSKKVYDDLQSQKSKGDPTRMPVDRPRDLKQVENAKYAQKQERNIYKHEVFNALEVAKQTNNFVRRLTIYPDLIVHLADHDLLKMTKSTIQLSTEQKQLKQVVSYDTTFCLGNFYLSVLVCRDTRLEDDPIFPFGFLIHERKFYKHHVDFLRDLFPEIGIAKSNAVPVVTDRERGLTMSLKKHFPEIKNIFCTNHILRDVEFWVKNHGGFLDDIKVLKDDVSRLINCDSLEEFDETQKVLMSTWTESFQNYFKKHLSTDLQEHACKFVTKKFAAFQSGTVTNNISESMSNFIESVNKHAELPLDCIILALKQLQENYLYDFMRALTGFGKYRLKNSFLSLQTHRNKVQLPEVKTMKDIIAQILDSRIPRNRCAKKDQSHRLTQTAIAQICIERDLVGFCSNTSTFSVGNPYGNKVQSVKYFPKPSTCSCPSTGKCFHIIAIEMSLGDPETSLDNRSYSLGVMRRNARGSERKSGRKRPRQKDFDYEVNPAPDAENPLDRKLIDMIGIPLAESTPSKKVLKKMGLVQKTPYARIRTKLNRSTV